MNITLHPLGLLGVQQAQHVLVQLQARFSLQVAPFSALDPLLVGDYAVIRAGFFKVSLHGEGGNFLLELLHLQVLVEVLTWLEGKDFLVVSADICGDLLRNFPFVADLLVCPLNAALIAFGLGAFFKHFQLFLAFVVLKLAVQVRVRQDDLIL